MRLTKAKIRDILVLLERNCLDAVLGEIEHFPKRTKMYGEERAEISTT